MSQQRHFRCSLILILCGFSYVVNNAMSIRMLQLWVHNHIHLPYTKRGFIWPPSRRISLINISFQFGFSNNPDGIPIVLTHHYKWNVQEILLFLQCCKIMIAMYLLRVVEWYHWNHWKVTGNSKTHTCIQELFLNHLHAHNAPFDHPIIRQFWQSDNPTIQPYGILSYPTTQSCNNTTNLQCSHTTDQQSGNPTKQQSVHMIMMC